MAGKDFTQSIAQPLVQHATTGGSRNNITMDKNKLREDSHDSTGPLARHATTGEMGAQSDSKVVPIVDLTPQGSGTGMTRLSQFYKDNFVAVLKRVEEYPTIVVSVTGLFRSGKSFLVNLMITFLEHLQKNGSSEGWVDSNVPVQGVNWAQQIETVTKGILMWKEPFVLQRSNGKKVAVVLIDCQGTGDVRLSSTKLDTLIFYISLQLSTIQIINLKTQMSANDLNTLVMCTAYADAAADGDEDTLFNRLIYVQRNWESDKVYGERPESEFKNLIRGSETSAEIKAAGEGILKAFQKVSTYAIPHPGSKLTGCSEGDTIRVSGDDIESPFLNAVCELFENMFCKPGMDKEAAKGKTIIEDFKNLERRVAENDVETNCPRDNLDDSRAYKAYKTVSTALEEKYKSLLKEANQGDTTQEVLDRKLDGIYQSTVLLGYDKAYRRKPGSEKTKGYSKHFAELERKFRDQKENIIEQSKKATAVKKAAIEKAKLKAEMQKREEQRKAQMQRIERERKAERQKMEKEKEAEMQRVEKERKAERQRLEKEKEAEMQRVEKERIAERQKMEKEKEAEMQRIEKERKAGRQKMEKEKEAEMQRIEKERKAERQKMEKERQAEMERIEKERKAEMQKMEEKEAEMQRVEKERKAEMERAERQRNAELEEKKRKKQETGYKVRKVFQSVGTGVAGVLGGMLGGPAGAAIGVTAYKSGTDVLLDDE